MLQYYRGDIVTDLGKQNKYKVISDNGNTLDVMPLETIEGVNSELFDCDKNVFSLINRPFLVKLKTLFKR